MTTDLETRRDIAERFLVRARLQGVALADDADFMALLEEWISTRIPMRVMRERYFSAVAQRQAERFERVRSQHAMMSNQDGRSSPPEADKKEGPSVKTEAQEL